MNRLKEIEARMLEIRELLKGDGDVDLDALEAEIRSLTEEKEKILKRAAMAAGIQAGTVPTTPVQKPDERAATPDVQMGEEAPPRLFRSFVQQLAAVKRAATEGHVDERLTKLNQAEVRALGGSAGVGADGGFAVQTDFAGMMMESAAKSGELLSRVDSYNVTDGSNSVRWVDIDESSIATTVFGGVRVYWAAEAAAVAATNPKLLERELKLEKLMGVAYATYELESDSSFVNTLYTRAFELAIQRELEGCIVAGNGVGKPVGFLNGGSLVSVPAEAGQAADTILWENLSKMYHRALDKSKMVWVCHPDAHEQLDFLSFPVGVGGVPVYLPASAVGTIDTLRGKPVINSDHCPALGDVGDMSFIDPQQYMLAYKGGVDVATSIHVQFLTAENCFRFIFRANGMPKRRSAMTIKNSAKQRSSFIAIAAR